MKKSVKDENKLESVSNPENHFAETVTRKIVKFKTNEDQEFYFLNYYYGLSPIERLRALAALQLRNRTMPLVPVKKISILKHHLDQ
jgi:hypothetical protein